MMEIANDSQGSPLAADLAEELAEELADFQRQDPAYLSGLSLFREGAAVKYQEHLTRVRRNEETGLSTYASIGSSTLLRLTPRLLMNLNA